METKFETVNQECTFFFRVPIQQKCQYFSLDWGYWFGWCGNLLVGNWKYFVWLCYLSASPHWYGTGWCVDWGLLASPLNLPDSHHLMGI